MGRAVFSCHEGNSSAWCAQAQAGRRGAVPGHLQGWGSLPSRCPRPCPWWWVVTAGPMGGVCGYWVLEPACRPLTPRCCFGCFLSCVCPSVSGLRCDSPVVLGAFPAACGSALGLRGPAMWRGVWPGSEQHCRGGARLMHVCVPVRSRRSLMAVDRVVQWPRPALSSHGSRCSAGQVSRPSCQDSGAHARRGQRLSADGRGSTPRPLPLTPAWLPSCPFSICRSTSTSRG